MGSLYSDHPTWLHGVPAGVKLAFLALLGTGVFLTSSLFGLLASATGCVVIFASLGRATLRAKPAASVASTKVANPSASSAPGMKCQIPRLRPTIEPVHQQHLVVRGFAVNIDDFVGVDAFGFGDDCHHGHRGLFERLGLGSPPASYANVGTVFEMFPTCLHGLDCWSELGGGLCAAAQRAGLNCDRILGIF